MATLSPLLRAAAQSLCTPPTATYCEHHVLAALRPMLEPLPHVTLKSDRFGNLLARYRRGKGAPPVCLVAHTDHPGFGINQRRGQPTPHLLGGVKESYLPGKTIEFFGPETTAPLGQAVITATAYTKKYRWVETDRPVPRGAAFAMWKLPAGSFRGGRWVGRVCDDLANVATMTALLQTLAKEQAEADVWCLYTRAEEIGFLGALAAEKGGLLPPKRVPILSLETSQARGFAKIGAGPIVRVGDRSTIFTPEVTYRLEQAAAEAGVAAQRLLMGGGTCEATAFFGRGRPVGGLCLALHNYHNMTARGSIGPEAVDATDWQQLLDLLHCLCRGGRAASAAGQKRRNVASRLEQFSRFAIEHLPKSAHKSRPGPSPW
ncbi:MAG: hypothetical protein AAGK14_09120 [Verrucomicrobiota bacterium]